MQIRCSKKIKYLREKSSLTRKSLAELSGIAESTIKSWERGLRTPTIANLSTLLNVYKERGITVNNLEWFFSEETDIEQGEVTFTNENYPRPKDFLFDQKIFTQAYKNAYEILSNLNLQPNLDDLFEEISRQYQKIILDKLASGMSDDDS